LVVNVWIVPGTFVDEVKKTVKVVGQLVAAVKALGSPSEGSFASPSDKKMTNWLFFANFEAGND